MSLYLRLAMSPYHELAAEANAGRHVRELLVKALIDSHCGDVGDTRRSIAEAVRQLDKRSQARKDASRRLLKGQ